MSALYTFLFWKAWGLAFSLLAEEKLRMTGVCGVCVGVVKPWLFPYEWKEFHKKFSIKG